MQVGYIYKHCTYTVCEMHIFTHTHTQNYPEKFWFSSIFIKVKFYLIFFKVS